MSNKITITGENFVIIIPLIWFITCVYLCMCSKVNIPWEILFTMITFIWINIWVYLCMFNNIFILWKSLFTYFTYIYIGPFHVTCVTIRKIFSRYFAGVILSPKSRIGKFAVGIWRNQGQNKYVYRAIPRYVRYNLQEFFKFAPLWTFYPIVYKQIVITKRFVLQY